jgi:hypothetical protein
VNDPNFIRIKYIRYADDWLIGIGGPRALAQHVKEEISGFLKEHLKLTLSEEKTHITHARTQPAYFLGVQIAIGRGGVQRVVKTNNGSGRRITRRSTGSEVVMDMPLRRIIQRLHQRGFCSALGESTTKIAWMNLDADQIVRMYNSVNRGLQNYYRFVDNLESVAHIQHLLRFSLARTLAGKYKISVKKVFQRWGRNITITVKTEGDKPDRQVSFYFNSDWQKQRNAFRVNDAQIDLVQTAWRLRTRSKLGQPCCLCGATGPIVMHHVRHIRKIGQKVQGFTRVMQALNRKQIPVCKSCHRKIHRGQYDGIGLSEFAYDPR